MPATGIIETPTDAPPTPESPFEFEFMTRVRVRLGNRERWGWVHVHGHQDGADIALTVEDQHGGREVRFAEAARSARELFVPAAFAPVTQTA